MNTMLLMNAHRELAVSLDLFKTCTFGGGDYDIMLSDLVINAINGLKEDTARLMVSTESVDLQRHKIARIISELSSTRETIKVLSPHNEYTWTVRASVLTLTSIVYDYLNRLYDEL